MHRLLGKILIVSSLLALAFLLFTLFELESLGISMLHPRVIVEFSVFITLLVAGLILNFAVLGLMDQYRHPSGRRGRFAAKLMNKGHEPLTLWGLTKVKIASYDVILDVGCGGGKTLGRLAQLAPLGKVFGVDNSSDMVDYSKKVNEKLIARDRVQIVGGSVEKMFLPDNYFDLVTAFEAYYFWLNFHDALKEIKRVLKPSGKLCLVNEMAKDGVYEIKNAKLIEKTHVHLVPVQEIRNAMLSIGFADVQVFTKTESPWNTVLAQK